MRMRPVGGRGGKGGGGEIKKKAGRVVLYQKEEAYGKRGKRGSKTEKGEDGGTICHEGERKRKNNKKGGI